LKFDLFSQGAAFLAVAFAGIFQPVAARCQPPSAAQISFHFEWPGTEVPEYTFVIHEDGAGTYEASVQAMAASPNAARYAKPDAARIMTHLEISYTMPPAFTQRLFTQMHNARLEPDCASKQKNIANTGMKTLTYVSAAGSTQCTFNYTENNSITALAETFEAMSFTLSVGRKLTYDERFDRLGLDHDMNGLVEAAKEHRAQGFSLIASELQSLINNERVMERVRRNASALLDKAALAP
jgi:hypothetical protein